MPESVEEQNRIVSLRDGEWETLIRRIKEDKCTPFLGAGACYGYLPTGQAIADRWAGRYGFPLHSRPDLPSVAQFLSVEFNDPVSPKEKLLEEVFKNKTPLNCKDAEDPHCFLADLPLSVFLTTNYDSYMSDALVNRGKTPSREICQWNQAIRNRQKNLPSAFENSDLDRISVTKPVVFHLHGHETYADSLVLTSDDYYDFLVNVSRSQKLIPPLIQERWANSTLLFLGYSLQDSTFQVIFRSMLRFLEKSLIRTHISVQLAPVKAESSRAQKEQVEQFLNKYFRGLNITVYWGTCKDFIQELRAHWVAN